jgi:hypothetical protein
MSDFYVIKRQVRQLSQCGKITQAIVRYLRNRKTTTYCYKRRFQTDTKPSRQCPCPKCIENIVLEKDQ